MAKYINKTALVAEIERLISNGQTKLKESEECNDYESYVALAERIATCINVLSILDTIEVKEIDLEEKACDAYCKVCGHYAHTTPNHICRQACDYYKNFVNYLKGK